MKRHVVSVQVSMCPLRDCPKEVAYMQRRQAASKTYNPSPLFQSRIDLMRGLKPAQALDTSSADDSGLLQRLEVESQGGVQTAIPYESSTRAVASQSSAGDLDAAALDRDLEHQARGRECSHLLHLISPSTSEGRAKLLRLHDLLQQGHEASQRDHTPVAEDDSAPETHPAVTSMTQLIQEVKLLQSEERMQTSLAKLLNAVASELAETVPPNHCGDPWLRGISGQGSSLFVSHGNAAVGDIAMRDKPDAVGLMAKQDVSDDGQANTFNIAAWLEVRANLSADLGQRRLQQVLRHELRNVSSNAALGRSYGFTLCGQVARLWVFDAAGYTTSRAIDILHRDDLFDFALALAFLTGRVEHLVQRWSPPSGVCFVQSDPDKSPDPPRPERCCSRIEFGGRLQPLNDASLTGLFGRRTAVWGGRAKVIEEGWLQDGNFVPDHAIPPRHSVDVIVKASWLTEYLVKHEHRVLDVLGKANVKNVPRSLGFLELPTTVGPPWRSYRPAARGHSADLRATSLEPKDARLHFSAMLLESEIGSVMPVEIEPFDIKARVAALRALLQILLDVSSAGVHYRDINRGNILLKSNWQALLERGDKDIVILTDFGNSRIGNEQRGDADSLIAHSLPLGLDDVLSVNPLFRTTNALRCLDLHESCRIHLRDNQDATNEDNEDLERLQRTLQTMDHRYIDDIESSLYCFIYHAHLCPTADLEWSERLHQTIQHKKRYIWLEEGWDSWVPQPAAQKSAVLTRDISRVLSAIRRDVVKAQERTRSPENATLRAVELTDLEVKTYLGAIGALDAWIDKKVKLANSAPSQPAAALDTAAGPNTDVHDPNLAGRAASSPDTTSTDIGEARSELHSQLKVQERLRCRSDMITAPATLPPLKIASNPRLRALLKVQQATTPLRHSTEPADALLADDTGRGSTELVAGPWQCADTRAAATEGSLFEAGTKRSSCASSDDKDGAAQAAPREKLFHAHR